ncbi:HAT (Half-A-TPR) repeat [Parasponia andersonii]|uniref:HAT (Half-A-TPR) repeat n=1 Tax=Parasponia andersonii TaxID=3476 RepID=A0A2P5CBP2_PARAD|nr:HAT (Half-A-TPR) repeat [Parasponia andersonii]
MQDLVTKLVMEDKISSRGSNGENFSPFGSKDLTTRFRKSLKVRSPQWFNRETHAEGSKQPGLGRHLDQLSPLKCWESICEGLQIFPYNPELCSALVQIGNLYTTPNKLRRMFDEYCQKKQSVVIWIFALSFEISRGGTQHRVRGLFERALGNDTIRHSVLLWRCYIAYEVDITCDPTAARRIFFRAIHACPWSKKLWMDGFVKLNSILSAKELSDLQEVMRDKELNLRTDMYEILLQDELAL